MAYRSQAERKRLYITVPLVQVDATGCIDASPGRPVLDVSPKALGSPTKQSLQQQQRKINAAAVEVHQRRRRSCHGTLVEQHSPGWQLKQSWTLDSKQADGTSCSSNTTAANITSTTSNRSRQDAAGSSSKQDQQQVQPVAGLAAAAAAAAVPAAHAQQHEQAAADAEVAVQAARTPSPFAAPEVQACTCHAYSGKQCCKVHYAAATLPSSNMVYTGTTTSSSSSSSTRKTKKVGQKLRRVAKALWQGMSLACWHPSATVFGVHGAYMLRK